MATRKVKSYHGLGIVEVSWLMKGLSGFLSHNGRLVDPMDPAAKVMKSITGDKQERSEAVHLLLSQVEWFGSIYTTATTEVFGKDGCLVDDDARVIVPAANVEAMFVEAAKGRLKGGKKRGQSALLVLEDCVLEYPGPTNVNQLWAEGKHKLRVPARVGTKRIMRTRPLFREWSLRVNAILNTRSISEENFWDVLEYASIVVGLGDWRPKYGRFEVARV